MSTTSERLSTFLCENIYGSSVRGAHSGRALKPHARVNQRRSRLLTHRRERRAMLPFVLRGGCQGWGQEARCEERESGRDTNDRRSGEIGYGALRSERHEDCRRSTALCRWSAGRQGRTHASAPCTLLARFPARGLIQSTGKVRRLSVARRGCNADLWAWRLARAPRVRWVPAHPDAPGGGLGAVGWAVNQVADASARAAVE